MASGRTAARAALLALAGCSSPAARQTGSDEPAAAGAPATADVPARARAGNAGPVIARIAMRDVVLTVHATGAGPRFSLETPEGVAVASDLDARQLADRQPDAYQVYSSAVASVQGGGTDRPFLDARVDAAGREKAAPGGAEPCGRPVGDLEERGGAGR